MSANRYIAATTRLTLAALTVLAIITAFGVPATAAAATCGDYATQAQAQQAADTQDANGNGVFCVISPR